MNNKKKGKEVKFAQIAVATSEDWTGLFALDEEGRIWRLSDYANADFVTDWVLLDSPIDVGQE